MLRSPTSGASEGTGCPNGGVSHQAGGSFGGALLSTELSSNRLPFSVELTREFGSRDRQEGVIEDARRTLAAVGFKLTRVSSDLIEAECALIASTKENPLRGAGRLSLWLAQPRAVLRADLRGTGGLSAFILLFPPALVLALHLWSASGVPMSKPPRSGSTLSHLWLWPPVGLAMVWWIHYRTKRAVRDFFDGLWAHPD